MFLNDFFQFNPFNFLEKVFMYFISKRDIKLRFRENSDKICPPPKKKKTHRDTKKYVS